MGKLYLSALLCTLVLTTQVSSQSFNINWSKGTDFPLRLSEIKAISHNGKIYVVGGRINNSTTDFSKNENVDYVFEYNPENHEWSRKTNMPFKDYDVVLAGINDKIFAIGSKTAMYTPASDKWQLINPLEDGKAHLEAAVVNGKIFVFGFFECTNPNKTMMYDLQTDTWTERAPMPTARIGPCVAVVDNKIYVTGGIGLKENGTVDISQLLHCIEVYNPEKDNWETKKTMPTTLWGAEGVIVKDDKIYFINIRSSENNPEHTIYMYNPNDETWATVPHNLPKRYGEQGVTLLDNKIYVIGGHDNSFNQYSDVFIGEFIRNINIQ